MSDVMYTKLKNTADIGADFEAFITSNIGTYLLRRAEKEEIEVLRELVKVSVEDTKEILRLQLQAEVPRRLLQFIDEVLKDGKVAKWQLEQDSET